MKVKTDLKSNIPDERKVEFVNTALNFLNDSIGTTLSVLYPASKIALGAIFLASLQLDIAPILSRQHQSQQIHSIGLSWFQLIRKDIDAEALKDICFQMIEVYEFQRKSSSRSNKRVDVNVEVLKREVDQLRSAPTEASNGSFVRAQLDAGSQDRNSKNSDMTRTTPKSSVREGERDGYGDDFDDDDVWEAPP
eukprot:CAMPEP_0116894040 /NCGR_PEP_ID=MMETSP0467-20121206/3910_1 /TAXON_ID=283647 /ORGANISM="Mesodinium pulex, Strain SPMC105" /LENGTH=192 /DNA_ID=CAMNT_0004564065 /DNA_START=417 /DNA_END=991 /DNA_ORIENTATION=+